MSYNINFDIEKGFSPEAIDHQLLNDRAEDVANSIVKVAREMGMPIDERHQVYVSFSPYSTTLPNGGLVTHEGVCYYRVELPYFFLLKHADVPDKFCSVEGGIKRRLSYDELTENGLLDAYFQWTKKAARVAKSHPEECGIDQRFLTRSFIKAGDGNTSDEQFDSVLKMKKATKFLFGHELAHAKHEDSVKEGFFSKKNALITGGCTVIGVGASIATGGVAPAVGAAIGAGIGLAASLVRKLRGRCQNHSIEFRADLEAARTSKDMRDGGIYFFTNLIESVQDTRREECCGVKAVLTSDGNSRTCEHTHPLMTERLKAIESVTFA